MEAPWRQGRGRGRARPGDGLAARAGAAARPPAPRARGGACGVAGAGTSGEVASGECRVRPPRQPGPGRGLRGAGAAGRAVARSPAGSWGAPANAGVGAFPGAAGKGGGRVGVAVASRCFAVRVPSPARRYLPGEARGRRAAAGGSGLRPPQGARPVPCESEGEG